MPAMQLSTTQYAEIVNFHDIKEFNQKFVHFKIDNFAQIMYDITQDKLKIIEINIDATLPITMGFEKHNYYDYLIHKLDHLAYAIY